MYNFQAEFMAYLDEVKGMNSEEMSNGMMKAEFRSFVEDFNTATMVRLSGSRACLSVIRSDSFCNTLAQSATRKILWHGEV